MKPFLENSHTENTVAVMGLDIDFMTCLALTVGDHVLVEINGERIFSHSDHPLLVDFPWTVESNSRSMLVISHPLHSLPLVLHYSNCKSNIGPAVFIEYDSNISELPVHIILQFVSHYMTANDAKEKYLNSYNPVFLQRHRLLILRNLADSVGRLRGGWRYISRARFSLRSGVGISDLERLSRNMTLDKRDDAALNRICREFGWMESFKQATRVLPSGEYAQEGDEIYT